jgi:NAD(P)-dependent dehydrogenase (short-subunit alcohol dehydrogenase family)
VEGLRFPLRKWLFRAAIQPSQYVPRHPKKRQNGHGFGWEREQTVVLVVQLRLPLQREGADVAISYLSEVKDARETERLVTEAGCQAILLPGDIGGPSECKAVAQKAIDALGTIDILVNNAHFSEPTKTSRISDDEFEETYRVNVFAMFRLCKALLPQMKEGGSIY